MTAIDWLLHPLRTWRRRRLLTQPFPAAWLTHLEPLAFYRRLDLIGQQRIRDDLRVLIAEKNWEGCGGLVLTDEIRVVVAATACLLLVGLQHDHYANVSSILVYPAGWRKPGRVDELGIWHPDAHHLGEAWRDGPVLLSWDAARRGSLDPDDGENLVLHEFAHKLDMANGPADGRPPLRARADGKPWHDTMRRAFEALREDAEHGRSTLLDRYGATNPAEFFAVATECFFERSAALRERHPDLYATLRRYYGQDPALREHR